MEKNPPSAADVGMLEKLAAVHVGPGMEFDASVLIDDIQAGWQEMLKGLRPKLAAEGMRFFEPVGAVELFRRADRRFRYGIRLPCAGGDRGAWGEHRGGRAVSQDGEGC